MPDGAVLPPAEPDATATVVGFARTLRAAGVPATTDRVQAFVQALDVLDGRRRADVYWAGRLTLCAGPDDLVTYDAAFDAYFSGRTPRVAPRPSRAATRVQASTVLGVRPAGAGEEAADALPVATAASRQEVLRSRDIAALTDAQRAELARLLAALRLPGERRRTRRHVPAPRGRVDRARTVRALVRSGGEVGALRRAGRVLRPRRVVLLVDISGSMSAYADALLRFAHAAGRGGRGPTEVFTIGTRLTRVTREMGSRDPDRALAAVAAAVPDWHGGTRLGERVKEFLDRWGQRGMARGAVVVVLSDGWEVGDPALLGAQMGRLQRLAHRVVWANPRAGRPGYAPLAAGMAAALPHCDDLVSGHSLAALEHLAAVVAGATREGP